MKKLLLLMTLAIASMTFTGCATGDNLLDGEGTTAIGTTAGVTEDNTAVTSAAIEGITTGTDMNNGVTEDTTIPVTTEGLETNSAS
jgi:hypothetical protein